MGESRPRRTGSLGNTPYSISKCRWSRHSLKLRNTMLELPLRHFLKVQLLSSGEFEGACRNRVRHIFWWLENHSHDGNEDHKAVTFRRIQRRNRCCFGTVSNRPSRYTNWHHAHHCWRDSRSWGHSSFIGDAMVGG